MDRKKTWVDNPTKKQAIVIFCFWLTSLVLLLIAMPDIFTERPVKKNYVALWLLLFSSTITMIPVVRNYLKNKKETNKSNNEP